MAKKKIAEYIADWMDGFNKNYELFYCEFVKEGSEWYLRVFVDKIEDDGSYGTISTDDCELISRYLSKKLDEEDPILQNYYLEVSSPGMDRPLLSEKDYLRFMGSDIEIKLYKAENGNKQLYGKLVGYENGKITIECKKGELLCIEKEKTSKVNLAVVF